MSQKYFSCVLDLEEQCFRVTNLDQPNAVLLYFATQCHYIHINNKVVKQRAKLIVITQVKDNVSTLLKAW